MAHNELEILRNLVLQFLDQGQYTAFVSLTNRCYENFIMEVFKEDELSLKIIFHNRDLFFFLLSLLRWSIVFISTFKKSLESFLEKGRVLGHIFARS